MHHSSSIAVAPARAILRYANARIGAGAVLGLQRRHYQARRYRRLERLPPHLETMHD